MSSPVCYLHKSALTATKYTSLIYHLSKKNSIFFLHITLIIMYSFIIIPRKISFHSLFFRLKNAPSSYPPSAFQ